MHHETNRNLKKKVKETKNKEEAKEVIEKAGMELTDEELDQVAGGLSLLGRRQNIIASNVKKIAVHIWDSVIVVEGLF